MESLESWRSTSIISGMLPMNVLVLDAGELYSRVSDERVEGQIGSVDSGQHAFVHSDRRRVTDCARYGVLLFGEG